VRRADNSLVGVDVLSFVQGARTYAYLTFTGADIVAGSLADGNYRLVINADRVRNRVGRALDGDGSGTPGGNFTDAFYRLFGDADGDRDVDADDQMILQTAFGTRVGDDTYLYFFDFGGDGDIDADDFVPFANRYGARLEP